MEKTCELSFITLYTIKEDFFDQDGLAERSQRGSYCEQSLLTLSNLQGLG